MLHKWASYVELSDRYCNATSTTDLALASRLSHFPVMMQELELSGLLCQAQKMSGVIISNAGVMLPNPGWTKVSLHKQSPYSHWYNKIKMGKLSGASSKLHGYSTM